MRIKHGKVVFGYKDTFSMDTTLAPIICAGLKKFKEVISEGDDDSWRKGLPASVSEELISQGMIAYQDDYSLSESDWDTAMRHYEYILDEMIFAFDSNNEPDISDYDFSYKVNTTTPDETTGSIPTAITSTNKVESERYTKDLIAYNERCDKGREMFSRYFKSLWW